MFRVFIEFFAILLLLYILTSWLQGMLAALEGEVLTTGPSGKSPVNIY